jgi:hypothetical protein
MLDVDLKHMTSNFCKCCPPFSHKILAMELSFADRLPLEIIGMISRISRMSQPPGQFRWIDFMGIYSNILDISSSNLYTVAAKNM